MSADRIGQLWADLEIPKALPQGKPPRTLPPIPDTGWAAPTEFPDLSAAKAISIDTETKDPELLEKGPGVRRGAHIVGISVGTDTGERWYFPMRHEVAPEQNLDPAIVIEWAKRELTRPGQVKVGANLLYDLDFLAQEGVHVAGPFEDVQIAEPLLDENRFTYSLDSLGKKYLDEGKTSSALQEWAERAYSDKNYRKNIWRCPPCLVGPYAEGDVDLPLRILAIQKPLLEAQGLNELFGIESRLAPILLAMRRRGVRVDLGRAQVLDDELTQAIAVSSRALRTAAGFAVNVNAGSDLARMFDQAGVQYPKTPKGAPSFTAPWLESFDHPLCLLVREVRKLTKMRDTFIRGYIFGCQINGRIHCEFVQLKGEDGGAVSGRLSSRNPNLQNIPARDKIWGPKLRSLFVPEEGEQWFRHDWSQIEYRFLAHFGIGSNADEVRAMYNDDPSTDFHNMVMEMTGLERKAAKGINFGLCIAEGQRVLTDKGLVPIEKITALHCLWDGVEWVRHAGVICMGTKEVMIYEGLTATPDHVVWDQEGRQVPLREAASRGIRLARTGTELGCPTFAGDAPGGSGVGVPGHGVTMGDRAMRGLRGEKENQSGQLQIVPRLCLSVWEIPRQACAYLGATLRCYGAALQKVDACFFKKLYRAWDRGALQIAGGLCTVGFEEMASGDVYRDGHRPKGQRRALREAEPPPCNAQREPVKSAKVYDIVNAGPRNRFTCEGVLVHNCYGMGAKTLAASLGLSVEEATRTVFNPYHAKVPFVKETFDYASMVASNRGYVKTILGRRARFDAWGGSGWSDDRVALTEEAAREKYGNKAQRAFVHKALNRVLQGSSADMMKKAMVDIWEAGICEVIGAPLVTVHDELGNSVGGSAEQREAVREVKHIMETCIKLKVPVLVDEESGSSWGELK